MADTSIQGLVGRLRSTASYTNPQLSKTVRVDAYGDQFMIPTLTPLQGAALSGSYWCAANPTPGTEIAITTSQTAYDQNVPVFLIQNTHSTRYVIPDFLSLKIEALPTSATRILATIATYTGTVSAINYLSGGTALTSRSCLIGGSETSIAASYFGAIASTDVAKTIMWNGALVDVIPVIDSQYVFRWGHGPAGSSVMGETVAVHRVLSLPPICLGPYSSMELYLYGDSAGAAASFELGVGWMEV